MKSPGDVTRPEHRSPGLSELLVNLNDGSRGHKERHCERVCLPFWVAVCLQRPSTMEHDAAPGLIVEEIKLPLVQDTVPELVCRGEARTWIVTLQRGVYLLVQD